ncbi:transposase [Stenotrophomonas sp. NPDC077659]|uniref:transposase n=1 Tax=Stenotrophomonas sp. NPDC077659 TaxID=3390694 RepID=UPI003D00E3B7
MPRQSRMTLPGQPSHVVQRGVNKCAIFVDDIDRQLFLQLLHRAFGSHGVSLHAYVLMSNHVHLLVTPATGKGLADAMRSQGNSYVQAFNRRHGRCGPLWQGRFHSTLVDRDDYLLSVYRYIELNPVRAQMVPRAEDHPWSSVRGNLRLRHDPLLTPHASFLALADNEAERTARYAAFLEDPSPGRDLSSIRRHTTKQRPIGDTAFVQMVERTLSRSAELKPQGRPRKTGTEAT